MSGTRPDICFVVTYLSQFMSKPTNSHLSMAKHVLCYLKGTVNYGLTYKKFDTDLRLNGFCDTDWGTSHDRCSITGYYIPTVSEWTIDFLEISETTYCRFVNV